MINSTTQRSLIGVAAALSWQPLDGDGIATDPEGAVTVDVSRANGTALVTGASATSTASEPCTYTLPAAHTALTDVLTVVWYDDGTERARTTVEIVGDYFVSIAGIRASDSSLLAEGKYSNEDLIRARTEVEHALSSMTETDFAPRFHYDRLDGMGTDTLELPWGPLRSVRSARIYWSATDYTELTATELAAIPAANARLAVRTDGCTWPAGHSNIVIEYETGYTAMPFDLRDQFYIEVRKQLNDSKSPGQVATPFSFPDDVTLDPAELAQQRRFFATLRRHSLRFIP